VVEPPAGGPGATAGGAKGLQRAGENERAAVGEAQVADDVALSTAGGAAELATLLPTELGATKRGVATQQCPTDERGVSSAFTGGAAPRSRDLEASLTTEPGANICEAIIDLLSDLLSSVGVYKQVLEWWMSEGPRANFAACPINEGPGAEVTELPSGIAAPGATAISSKWRARCAAGTEAGTEESSRSRRGVDAGELLLARSAGTGAHAATPGARPTPPTAPPWRGGPTGRMPPPSAAAEVCGQMSGTTGRPSDVLLPCAVNGAGDDNSA